MNLTGIDVSDVPEKILAAQPYVQVIGPNVPINYLAACAKTTMVDIWAGVNRQ